ncbi:MAG: hypothetical protein J7M17_08970 [Anaerolineae bacterium]|nr:hypothetical protein [Anaerolineae bacterium]
MEAIVDAYDTEEQIMGWYYYLEDKINVSSQYWTFDKAKLSPTWVGMKMNLYN